jgi:4-hydroxythreonine-4-phosphate dehydrogenase
MTASASNRPQIPIIAVTTGDPAGIGPEIVARLFSAHVPERSAAVLIGAPSAFGPWLKRTGLECPVTVSPDEALALAGAGAGRVVILHTGVEDGFPVGADSAGGGRHAGRAIELALELANNRAVDGIVTAPISKKSLNLAEFRFTGHTEMLAHYLKAPDCQMMMVHRSLRVVPLTRHLALGEVAEHVTTEAIFTCVRVTARALEDDFGVEAPRLGLTGLNPHAGDGGVIGSEEQDIIAPAIRALRGEGLDVDGPFAADGLFPIAYRENQSGVARGRFDAYIAMYHDQAMIPFKMLSQYRGVNVTVGLPVVRTSVDHGTAYGLAGKGKAEIESLHEAYRLAEELCRQRARARRKGA